MRKPGRVTCRNRSQTRRTYGNDTFYSDCQGCPLVYTHLSSDSLSNDVVRCESPIPIKFGDTIEIVPQKTRRIASAAEAGESDNERR